MIEEPLSTKQRIIGYDLARALAVFGMVLVNFKIVMGAAENGPDWLVLLVGLFDGRAAATFVVLAGIGISLLSKECRTSGSPQVVASIRLTLLKRALFLFVVGSLYTPIWPADILHFYGLYIAVAAFLLTATVRRLWVVAGGLVTIFGLMILVLDYEKGWDWSTLHYEGLWTPAGAIRHLFFNGFHPVAPWLAFLLLGMIIGRLDMASSAVRRRVFGWGLAVATIAEVASAALIRLLSTDVGSVDRELVAALFGTEPMPPMPLYMLAGAGTASAIIAAAVVLGERFHDARWIKPFVATGQLALTLYVAHVVIGMGILEAVGRLEDQTLLFSVAAATTFSIAGIVYAHLWRKRFKRGPLEAIMRNVTNPKSSGG